MPHLAAGQSHNRLFTGYTCGTVGYARCVVAMEHIHTPQVNNLTLVELNEPSLLYNLRARFETQLPYTYTGELELMCLVRPCSKGGRTEGQRLRHPL